MDAGITTSQVLRLPVDPEPTSLRLVVLLAFIVGFIGGNILADTLFQWGVCTALSFGVGIAMGISVMLLAEKVLKPIWKSNRFVRVTMTEVAFLHGDAIRRAINPLQQVNVTQWRFTIKRRSRADKGWYVVAIALEQDDLYLPVYTLVSPERFEQFAHPDHFTELTVRREDMLRDRKGGGSDLRLSGIQRQIYIAETARSIDGVEMLPDDFETYLKWLSNYFYRWMP